MPRLRRSRGARSALVLLTVALFAGCGGGSGGASDAGRPDGAPPDAATDSAAPDSAPPEVDAGPPGPTSGPGAPGPFAVAQMEATVTRGDRETPVVAHLPVRDDGARSPVVLFAPGFQLTTERYLPLLERLASHGFVVVRADPVGGLLNVNHLEMTADLRAVLDWALDPSGPLSAAVDAARVMVSGHSLGGKLSAMVAGEDPRVTALLGIDPVNIGNPFTGYSDTLPDILPDSVADLAIPVGFLGETTNGTGGTGTPCAPLEANFAAFYEASAAATWAAAWDFEGADHMDFVHDVSRCLACSQCPDGSAEEAVVQDAMTTLVVAFARRHLGGEADLEPWLVGAMVPAGVTVTSR